MFPNIKIVEAIRKEYPAGTRVRLVKMDDIQAPPLGTEGTVVGVDDTGSLLMHWDNGSRSSLSGFWKRSWIITASRPDALARLAAACSVICADTKKQ